MRHIRCLLMLVLFSAFALSSAFAAAHRYRPPVSRKSGDSMFRLSAYGWMSEGDNSWTVSFTDVDGPGLSTLKWKDEDSMIYVLEGEFAPLSWLRVAARYGTGSVGEGDNSDKDFLSDAGVGDSLIAASIADTDVDTEFYSAELYFRITDYGGMGSSPSDLDLFVGYQYYKDGMSDSNGRFTADGDGLYDEPLAFGGLDSTYDFEWTGYKAGARAIVYVNDRLQFRTYGAYLFEVDFDGRGYWNLRDDFRAQSPNFVQSASGSGYELSAMFEYRIILAASLNFGYWMKHFEASGGTDTIYYADGSVAESRLDKVETDRDGFVVGVSISF